MPRSLYSTTRSNIVKQVKNLINKGYYAPSSSIDYFPPKVSELGHKPSQEDVTKLQQFREQLKSQLKIDISDKATGDTTTLSYEEGEKYFRKQAYKKGQLTKLMKDIPDKPPEYEDNSDDWIKAIDEASTIVENVKNKIAELVGFISSAKNTTTAKRNEEIVNGIGLDLLEAFEYAEEHDYNGLTNRIKNNAMIINADLDRAKTAYLEKDNGKAIAENLLAIFKGRQQYPV